LVRAAGVECPAAFGEQHLVDERDLELVLQLRDLRLVAAQFTREFGVERHVGIGLLHFGVVGLLGHATGCQNGGAQHEADLD